MVISSIVPLEDVRVTAMRVILIITEDTMTCAVRIAPVFGMEDYWSGQITEITVSSLTPLKVQTLYFHIESCEHVHPKRIP